MSTRVQCHCQSCTIRGLTGPAIVIAIGVLFLLHQLHGGTLDFGNTWPMILVVIGFLYLASALASREGHVETISPPVPPAPPVNPASPPPQAPYGQQGQ
jgi:ABC-type Fe3+ transport system permease subunit